MPEVKDISEVACISSTRIALHSLLAWECRRSLPVSFRPQSRLGVHTLCVHPDLELGAWGLCVTCTPRSPVHSTWKSTS